MTSYLPPAPAGPAAHFPPLPPQYPRRKNWFDRNWKWLIPLLLIMAISIFGSLIVGAFYFVDTAFKSTDGYKIPLQLALNSPAVQARLGTPIRVGRFTRGNFRIQGADGEAQVNIPLHGPRGEAMIAVVGKGIAGRWTFDTLEVDVEGDEKPIPLLGDTPTPLPPAIPSDSPGAPSGTT